MGLLPEIFEDAPGRVSPYGKFDYAIGGQSKATRMSSWVKYSGPRGGEGWRNVTTDEVRYQVEMPEASEDRSSVTLGSPVGSYGNTTIMLGGKPVGNIEYSLETPTGLMIQYIRVNPSVRKQGVAVEALRAFGEQARRAGRTEIYGKLTSKAAAKVMEKAFGKPLKADSFAISILPEQPPEDAHGSIFDPRTADAVYATVEPKTPRERADHWARLRMGDPIAAKRFADWFSGSEVVDEHGNPLVVFHGTNRSFDTFDANRGRAWRNDQYQGRGLFFSESHEIADRYAGAAANESLDRQTLISEMRAKHPGILSDLLENVIELGYGEGWEATRKQYGIEDKPFSEWPPELYEHGDDVARIAELAEGAKQRDRDPDVSDTFAALVGGRVGPSLSWVQEEMVNLGLSFPGESIMPVFLRATNVLRTDSQEEARAARDNGYDAVCYTGPDRVGDAAEWIVYEPNQVKSAIGNSTFDSSNPRITMSTWVKYKGPRGGDGWRNTVTDEVRYQAEMPGDNEPKAEALTGYDWHEKGAVREWAMRFPHKIQKFVEGYAGFGSTDINGMLRGTYEANKKLVFVRDQTPEEREMPQYKSVMYHDDYKPDVKGGEEYRQRNVLYRDENGIERGWAIVKMVDDQKLIDQTNESIRQINKGISDFGIVLDRDIEVYRAAYIPGLKERDLEKLVNSPELYEEKGFTSTFYGAEKQRLTGYAVAAKTESVYRRREKGDFSMEDSPALRIKIKIPKGTKVLSVEALRRISYEYPRTIPTDDPNYFARDFDAEPIRVNTADLDNPDMRSESEILLGSGAKFKITSVKNAGFEALRDTSVLKRAVHILDVEMEYIGGGSSDAIAK